MSSAFVGDLEAAVKLFVEKWQDHPEGANALAQKHEAELVRQELRPLVFEEVRLQVDDEMRILLQNLKVSFFTVLLAIGFLVAAKPQGLPLHFITSHCMRRVFIAATPLLHQAAGQCTQLSVANLKVCCVGAAVK